MTESGTSGNGTEHDWKPIAEESQHPKHWHYGDEVTDQWASITASDSGTIGGYYDEKWTVEFYNGEEPCERERAGSYPEMLEAVAEFMKQHERSLHTENEQ